MIYIPGMQESSAGQYGEGQIVYTTKKKPNPTLANNPALKQLSEANKQAQAQRRAAQAADKAARQAGKKGSVTVFDANKGAYVSASVDNARIIREENKELQAQRRAPQAADKASRQAGKKGNVTVFDANKGAYVPASVEEAKIITKANKRAAAVEGLNERITSHMGSKSHYGGKTVKSGNKFISVTAEQVEAQAQRRAAQAADKAVRQTSKSGNVTVFDASKGLHVSAATQEAKEIAVSNQNAGKVSQAASKKGFWSPIKGGLSNLALKAKNFLKSPKGKYTLIAAAVIAVGTGVWAYISDRFSDKNKPPTEAPSNVFMPKLEDSESDNVEETEESEKSQESKEKDEKNKADEAKVVPAPVSSEDTDKTDKLEEKEEKKEKDEVNTNKYKVVKGDNLWNIAKKYLQEQHKDDANYTLTDKEILQKTEELIKLNNKHYEEPLPQDSRKRIVIIEPDEKIKLIA